MRSWTDEQLTEAVKDSISVAQVIHRLGLIPAGGNYKSIKHHITRLRLDTSHHKGQSWSREKYQDPVNTTHKGSKKRHLIHEFGHRCWRCQLETWQGQPIPLELEHKDGNNANNDLDNLEILCCNCHALTATWRGRNRAPVAQR